MKHATGIALSLLLVAASAAAEEKTSPPQKAATPAPSAAAKTEASKPGADVAMSGMSILGNDEAPKSLVIVPWKSSQLGDTPGISRLLDDATQPVDREVFMRELNYYGIRTVSSGSK